MQIANWQITCGKNALKSLASEYFLDILGQMEDRFFLNYLWSRGQVSESLFKDLKENEIFLGFLKFANHYNMHWLEI